MELKKNIGLKYPTKKDINLAIKDRRNLKLKVNIPLAVAIVVFVSVFTKFAVIDVLDAVARAESNVMQTQLQLDKIKTVSSTYNEVLMQYNETVALRGVSPVKATPMEKIALVDTYLIPKGKVDAYDISGERITARVSGITLNQISEIYGALMADELVENVQVYTASTDDKKSELTTVTMTIMLAIDEDAVDIGSEGGGN